MKILQVSTNTFNDISDLTEPYMDRFNCDVERRYFVVDQGKNEFGTQAWNDITQRIVAEIVNKMKSMKEGEQLMYVDNDVLFLHDPKWFGEQLKDNDFIFQYETHFGPNFGFFVVRVTPQTIALLEKTRDATVNGVNSQIAFKMCMQNCGLKIAYFDTKDVWNYAVQSDGRIWNGEPIEWPPNLKAFHANFTIGNKNKLAMLYQAIKHYEPKI